MALVIGAINVVQVVEATFSKFHAQDNEVLASGHTVKLKQIGVLQVAKLNEKLDLIYNKICWLILAVEELESELRVVCGMDCFPDFTEPTATNALDKSVARNRLRACADIKANGAGAQVPMPGRNWLH